VNAFTDKSNKICWGWWHYVSQY